MQIPTFESFSASLAKDLTVFPMEATGNFSSRQQGTKYAGFYILQVRGLTPGFGGIVLKGPHGTLHLPNVMGQLAKQAVAKVGGVSKNRGLGQELGFRKSWDAADAVVLTEDQVNEVVAKLGEIGARVTRGSDIAFSVTLGDEAALDAFIAAFGR